MIALRNQQPLRSGYLPRWISMGICCSMLVLPLFQLHWLHSVILKTERYQTQGVSPLLELSPSSSFADFPVQIAVTTSYLGKIGTTYEQITLPHLAAFCENYGYTFLPYRIPSTYDDAATTSSSYFKWSKVAAMQSAVKELQKSPGSLDNKWIWWIDADILVVPPLMSSFSVNHPLQEVIQRVEPSNVSIIVLRRTAISSSSILLRVSAANKFLQAWDARRNQPREHERRWVDQGALIDMLFLPGAKNLRPEWQTKVHQVDCLCTDFGLHCQDWFCEELLDLSYPPSSASLLPTNHTQNTRHQQQKQQLYPRLIHAAGCASRWPLEDCLKGLAKYAVQQQQQPDGWQLTYSRSNQFETIYGLTVTRDVDGAQRAARGFFSQSYPTNKLRLIIATDSPSVSLNQLTDDPKIRVLVLPEKQHLGFLRQKSMEAVPEAAIFVQWDDDDVRQRDLLRQQYLRLGENDAVLLARTVHYDIIRNASVVDGGPNLRPGWHGLAGTIMGRKSVSTPSYIPHLDREEDSKFLQSMISSQRKTYVWDNPPHMYIRTFHSGPHASIFSDSMRQVLRDVRDNEWRIPLEDRSLVNLLRNVSRRDITSVRVASSNSSAPRMCYYVLSMPERRDSIVDVFSKAGFVEVEFVNGMRGNDLDLSELRGEGMLSWTSLPYREAKYPISKNEIAVYLGHIRMLEKFRADKSCEIGFFFQDDIVLAKGLNETVLQYVSNAPEDWDMINLGRCLATCDRFGPTFAPRFELCTAGFLVHRRGLDIILKHSLPIGKYPIDKCWDSLSKSRTIRGYSVQAVVKQDRIKNNSLLRSSLVPAPECKRDMKTHPKCSESEVSYSGWKTCGAEGEFCTCPKGAWIRFGCGDSWTPGGVEDPIVSAGLKFPCNVRSFGDPAPDTVKLCQCLVGQNATGWLRSGRPDPELPVQRPRVSHQRTTNPEKVKAAVVYLVEPGRVFQLSVQNSIDAKTGNVVAIPTGRTFPRNSTTCGRYDTSLLHSLTTLQNNFLVHHHSYPVILLHEEAFPEEHKEAIRDHVRAFDGFDLRFVEVSLDRTLDKSAGKNSCATLFSKADIFRQTEEKAGYLAMCDYMSFDIMHQPELLQFEYIMRVDTDSCISSRMARDPFLLAKRQGAPYVYRTFFTEKPYCFRNWKATLSQYMCTHKTHLSPDVFDVVGEWSQSTVVCDGAGKQTSPEDDTTLLRVFSTNWEILHLPSFRKPEVSDFLTEIRKTGFIENKRWGDAPIRTMTALLFFNESSIIGYSDWEYKHKGVGFEARPLHTGLEMPKSIQNAQYNSASQNATWCGVLTGTVEHHTDVDLLFQKDPNERLDRYVASLKAWKEHSSMPLIFVENSHAEIRRLRELEDERIEVLQVPTEFAHHNKGAAERDSVMAAVQKSATSSFQSCTMIFKVTGRFAPIHLDEALRRCPADTELVVQRKTHRNLLKLGGGIETQLLGWRKGGVFENWYRKWKPTEMIERAVLNELKHIGGCETKNVLENTAECRKVCFVGPLRLDQPTQRGGINVTELFI